MANKQFTDGFLKALKPKEQRYEVSEPGGLKLRVSPTGTKTWVYVYRQNNKLRRLTLGLYPTISLAIARAQATHARASKHQGEDPAANALQERMELNQALTVNELAKLYVEKHAKKKKRTWKEDERILKKRVKRAFGSLRARDIKRMHVIDLIEDIAEIAPYAANRTLEIIRKMFNWAIQRDVLEVNPCWQIPRVIKENKRDRVLDNREIKAVWSTLNTENKEEEYWPSEPVRLAIQICLLLAIRRSEIALAKVDEFDFNTGWWTIPADRTKNGLSHRVPLSPFCIELLQKIQKKNKESYYLLPSLRYKDKPIDPNALTRAVARLRKYIDIPHWRLHDLRRTAASHMASNGISRIVIGKILNHVESSVTAVYDRHSYDKEKCEALNSWSICLMNIVNNNNTIVSINIKKTMANP